MYLKDESLKPNYGLVLNEMNNKPRARLVAVSIAFDNLTLIEMDTIISCTKDGLGGGRNHVQ